MSTFVCHSPSPDDIDHILSIAKPAWKEVWKSLYSDKLSDVMYNHFFHTDRIKKYVNNNIGSFVTVWQAEQPAAFAAYEFKSDKVASIQHLYVHPKFDKTVLKTLLLNEIHKKMSDRSINILELNINQLQTEKLDFFLENGFSVSGKQKWVFQNVEVQEYIVSRLI